MRDSLADMGLGLLALIGAAAVIWLMGFAMEDGPSSPPHRSTGEVAERLCREHGKVRNLSTSGEGGYVVTAVCRDGSVQEGNRED